MSMTRPSGYSWQTRRAQRWETQYQHQLEVLTLPLDQGGARSTMTTSRRIYQ